MARLRHRAALAYRLDAGFVPIRKLGKLPGETISGEYEFGHTSEPIEMSVNVISPGEEVVLVDDMLATGAVSEAAAMLIHDLGGKVAECCSSTNWLRSKAGCVWKNADSACLRCGRISAGAQDPRPSR